MSGARQLRSALVVDDDALLGRSIARRLNRMGLEEVDVAQSVQEALSLLDGRHQFVLVDVCLNNESCEPVVERALSLDPQPRVVIMSGNASRGRIFALAALGVEACLEKPFGVEELAECLSALGTGDERLARIAEAQLGRHGAREVQQIVRRSMFSCALKRTGGNRHAAARLLRVDRRAVQRVASELDDDK